MMKEHPTHEQITARARKIYVESGCLPRHDIDNWLQAEYELLQLPVRELAKLPPPKSRNNKRRYQSIPELVKVALL